MPPDHFAARPAGRSPTPCDRKGRRSLSNPRGVEGFPLYLLPAIGQRFSRLILSGNKPAVVRANPDFNQATDRLQSRSSKKKEKGMLKLAIPIAFATLAVSYVPGYACDEGRAGYSSYSYAAPAVRRTAAYGYAPVGYYDDDDYGGFFCWALWLWGFWSMCVGG